MKKSLLALAVLGAFAGVAQAQTSVTIYGSFDGGVRWQNHVGTTAGTADSNRITMGSSGTYKSNRIGFKGVEDLGGGLNAHFNLESGFNNGTGGSVDSTRFFNRAANVGIGGAFGSVDLGRQYTVAYKTAALYDPFNFYFSNIIPTSGVSVSAGTRFDNDISYTGVFGPVTFRAEHALGEVVGSPSTGSANAAGLSYENGPFAVGAAYTWRKMGPGTVGIAGGNVGGTSTNAATSFMPLGSVEENKHWTLGGAYKFGQFRVAAGYADEKQNNPAGAPDTRIKNGWLGGSFDITPAMALTAAWYQTKTTGPATAVSPGGFDGKKDLVVVGATYALSKRTNFYADVDTAKFKGSTVGSATVPVPTGTAPFGQERTTGVSVGINHLF